MWGYKYIQPRIRLFLREYFSCPPYPFRSTGLLTRYSLLYQDEVRNVLWSLPESKLDQVIQSFKIGDSKSYLSFFHWQQVYAAVHTELTEELIAATISYLTYTHMTAATLPPDYMDKLNSELAELSSALEARIPEFSMQLQLV